MLAMAEQVAKPPAQQQEPAVRQHVGVHHPHQRCFAELQIRADDSPLRLNGSGLVIVNPPWQFDRQLAPALPVLKQAMGEAGAMTRLEWLKPEA